MVRGGLSSVSYRNAEAKTIIERSKSAALGGIEWTADTHAPHGDLKTAETLMMATLRAGLTVTSYGSFYRVGRGDEDRAVFSSVLETALRLQAPAVRVWAPSPGTIGADALAAEGAALADRAGRHGITLCLEPHEMSAVGSYDRLAELIEAAGHPFFKACWTQLPGSGAAESERAAERLGPNLELVHVRHWTDGYDRMPLDGDDPCWKAIAGLAETARKSVLDRWAVLEYLADERPETLERESKVLSSRLA